MATIIKRYRNRKLYNTQINKYINLAEIEELIKQKVEVIIIDNSTGRDITATTLSQIIFELEKNYSNFLPLSLLISLVQSGGNRLDEIRRNIFKALNLSNHYDVEIERRVNILIGQGEFSQEEGNRILAKLLAEKISMDEMIENFEERIVEYFDQRQLTTRKEYQNILHRLETLSKKVDNL